MKKCGICEELKELSEFNKNKSKKDGLQYACRICTKKSHKKYYQKNGDIMKSQIHLKRNERILNNRKKVFIILSESKCIDCKFDNPVALEFDHRDPNEKEMLVSELVRMGFSWKKIQKEIDKCDVRCANCHRIRTSIQFNWWYNKL